LPSNPVQGFFNDLSLSPDSGVAALFARKIVSRSPDEGNHWTSDTLPRPCNAISLASGNHIWAVGDSGLVYHSPGYGIPFSQQSTGFTEHLRALAAVNSQTVWVVGSNGLIAQTTNGGATWQQIPSPTTATLNSICFVDSIHGWIVGDSGVVLKVRDGMLATASVPGSAIPAFALLQNYPNPFNPTTTILYSVPARCIVSLKICDLIGREVAILMDRVLPAGQYQVTWDATNLASGPYFCRLQVGSSVQTKRILLLK
jgi:hypothetical protein